MNNIPSRIVMTGLQELPTTSAQVLTTLNSYISQWIVTFQIVTLMTLLIAFVAKPITKEAYRNMLLSIQGYNIHV